MGLIYQYIKCAVLKKKMYDSLTNREKEIYHLLIVRTPYADIAKTLTITLGTVKQHAHNIYIKLGIKSRKNLK